MEYLPEKKRTQQTQIMKKEKRIREFRQELVDNNVVLAIVKYLVAMRSQQQLPEDPTSHFMDYVGNQRSPLWDQMEGMEDENARNVQEIPSLESELSRLQTQLAEAQRKTRSLACFRQADPEGTNALSTKAMVAKMSGFAKFELDLKLNADQFCLLINNFSQSEGRFSEEKFNEIMEVLEKTFGEGASPPFAGDLENETYKNFLTTIREYSASEMSNK